MNGAIPVSVVGGYLGAGKTTLVNHLLRNAQGLRMAVLVNDFGALPIDADLIESAGDDLISIAGGCVCCAFGSDLMAALQSLAQRDPPPQRLIIETSGVALPGVVARSAALFAEYRYDGVIVLVDAETVRSRAADRYVGDTILRQLADADLIVLNKIDLLPRGDAGPLHAWLALESPRAVVIDALRGAVPPEALFGIDAPAARGGGPALFDSAAIRLPSNAATRFESVSFPSDQALDLTRLASEIAQPENGLVRAKGVLRDRDGTLKTLQLVGARCEVTVFDGPGTTGTGLVCIGLRGRMDRARISLAIARAAQGCMPDAVPAS